MGSAPRCRPSRLSLRTRLTIGHMIRSLSGIRVYRDGFGIRLSQDWLQLGKQWTSASSYYGLRPENTMGYTSDLCSG